jgi:hypothetical protein
MPCKTGHFFFGNTPVNTYYNTGICNYGIGACVAITSSFHLHGSNYLTALLTGSNWFFFTHIPAVKIG